jgi:hypothetical protein
MLGVFRTLATAETVMKLTVSQGIVLAAEGADRASPSVGGAADSDMVLPLSDAGRLGAVERNFPMSPNS